MISDIKKKEILTVKSMLDMYNNNIVTTNDEIAVIDEKYRAIAEKEKKELKTSLAELKSMKKSWEKMFNAFDEASVKEVLGENYTSNTASDEKPVTETNATTDDEVVSDKLFPENNESDVTPEPESELEEDAEASEEPIDETLIPSEQVEETEQSVPAESTDSANVETDDFDMWDNEEPVHPELNEGEAVDVDGGWPDADEVWKN